MIGKYKEVDRPFPIVSYNGKYKTWSIIGRLRYFSKVVKCSSIDDPVMSICDWICKNCSISHKD